MYHSDHELYHVATQRHREMLEKAAERRLASLCRGYSSARRRSLMSHLGAFLVSVGQKLQEE